MKPKHRRLSFVVIGLGLLAAATALALNASRDSLVFFRTPSELATKPVADGRRMRLGGLVETGSVKSGPGSTVTFRVTDLQESLPVQFAGILPDLFREGQGVVAEGTFRNGMFVADQVLAKHDEKYMPPEVAEALKKSGQWKPADEGQQAAGTRP